MPAAKAPARKRATVKPEDFIAVFDDLGSRVIEREQHIKVMGLTLLSGGNVLQQGEAGTAKSMLARLFSQSITDSVFFDFLAFPDLTADKVLGHTDMDALLTERKWKIDIEGYAPAAHIVHWDETFRGSGALNDAMLGLANPKERAVKVNGKLVRCPTLLLVGSTNFTPPADDVRSGAISDRFVTRLHVQEIRADANFLEMLERDRESEQEILDGKAGKHVTVTLDQVLDAQRQVREVTYGPDFKAAFARLRRDTKKQALGVSDRRWAMIAKFCRAAAWLAGRDHTIPEDLANAEHAMWSEIDEIPRAHELVLDYHGQFERKAVELRREIAQSLSEIAKIRPSIDSNPPGDDLPDEVTRAGIKLGQKFAASIERIDASLDEAKREKKDAANLRNLHAEVEAALVYMRDNGLPTGRWRG